jgi:hypothetical protein
VATLPEKALLPEDLLPDERRIKDLENQVAELKNAQPRLRLAFPGGSSNITLRFLGGKSLLDSDIADRVAHIRDQYPKIAESAEAASVRAPSSLNGILSAALRYYAVDPDSVRKYNRDLDGFFVEYEKYLRRLALFYAWEGQTAIINLMLFNDGLSPADDVDIFMHFPDGFKLFDEDDCDSEPEAPKPPPKPMSLMEQAAAGYQFTGFNFRNPQVFDQRRLLSRRSNVSGPKIQRTSSYDVSVHVGRAKHGIEVPLEVMYLTFNPGVARRGFSIDYSIHASNLPKPSIGRLNVIV